MKELKQDFEPFLKFYNEYKSANQNLKNNNLLLANNFQKKEQNEIQARKIMQEINRELNPNIKKK